MSVAFIYGARSFASALWFWLLGFYCDSLSVVILL